MKRPGWPSSFPTGGAGLTALFLCLFLLGFSNGGQPSEIAEAPAPHHEEAAPLPSSAPEIVAQVFPAREVRLGDHVIVTLGVTIHGRSPEARAQSASKTLEHLLQTSDDPQVSVRWNETRDSSNVQDRVAQLFIGPTLVLELYVEDLPGGVANPNVNAVVTQIVDNLDEALAEEQHRTEIATWVLSGSSVIFLGLLALLLLRGAGSWARVATAWGRSEGKALGALRIGTIELIPAGAVREGLRVGGLGGLWIVRVLIVYFWVFWSLSLFDATRGLAESATRTLLRPFVELLGRIASRIPVAFALLISLFLVILLMRFIGAYFRGVERGDIKSEWVKPETARVTGGLWLIALVLATLLFVAPLLSGANESVFSQLGLLVLGLLALSTLPMLVSCALGVRLVYSRSLRLGDELEYGGQRGTVKQIGLFDIVLIPTGGGRVRVPHLMSLWHVTRIYVRRSKSPSPSAEQVA